MWVLNVLPSSVDVTSVIIFFIVFLFIYHWMTSPRNLPPGPMGLPLVGNMLAVKSAPNLLNLLKTWQNQYGDIFTIKMGSKQVIVINSYELLNEAFVKQGETFSGRPFHLFIVDWVIRLTGKGVIFNYGPQWKEIRRVTLMTLRDFGVGKKTLEQRVQDESRAIMEVIDQGEGQPVYMKETITKFAANIICSVIFGQRFDYDDEQFTQLTKLITRAFRQQLIFNLANFVPIMRYVPSVNKVLHDAVDSFVEVHKFVGEMAKEHEDTYDPDEVRDFVDLYIKTREEAKDTQLYNAANMRRVIVDLFLAGTETAATTVDWITRYLVAYPHVQKRCQEEIDQVIGHDRLVTMDDRKDLPYMQAVFHEILRIVSVGPLAFPHMALRDAEVGGFCVPAGSMVVVNLRAIHLDPSTWTQPAVFTPQRFLDHQGKFAPPMQNFAPFSAGPRACLGEVLARMEVFVLFCSLVQFYQFSMPQGTKPDLTGIVGGTYQAVRQAVIATRR